MGRGSLCLVLGQNAGKLALEILPHHPATCQSFPCHSLPNILNMSGLHLLPSFLGLKGTGAQSSCPKALGPGAAL